MTVRQSQLLIFTAVPVESSVCRLLYTSVIFYQMSKVRDSYNALNMVGRETDSVRYGIPWRHSAPPRTLAELWFMRHGGSASWKNAPPSRYRYSVADGTAFAEADRLPDYLVTYLVS